MFTIPGRWIAFATLPGILFHEIAHWLACLLCGVRVLDFRYNTFEGSDDSPVGYVVYERADAWWKSAVIGSAPLFLNVPLTLAILLVLGWPSSVLQYPLYYFAFCLAFHSVPSGTDNQIVMVGALPPAKRGNPLAAAFVLLGWAVSTFLFLRRIVPNFIIDLIYAATIGGAAFLIHRAFDGSPSMVPVCGALVAALVLGGLLLVWLRRGLSPAPRSFARHLATYFLMSAGVCVAMMSVPFVNELLGGEHFFIGSTVTVALMFALVWADGRLKAPSEAA